MHIRYRTFSSIWNNFFDFFSFVKKNIVLLKSDSLGWCIHTLHSSASMPQHTPSLFVGSLLQERRPGWVKRHDIIKAFTWRSVWDSLESRKFKVIIVLSLATVDAPGVIISCRVVYWQPSLYSYGGNDMLYFITTRSCIFISAWALTLSVRL